MTARPRARQALRALVLGHTAQLQGKAASQPASRPAARRGPIERRAILSPVLIAVREKSGLVRDVQVRWPRDWVAYNLARARAWRLQSGRPLKRGKTVVLPSRAGRFPGRVPLRLLRRSKTKTTK